MKNYIVYLASALTFLGNAFSTSVTSKWSGIATVKELSAAMAPAGGMLFSDFRINNSECAINTNNTSSPVIMSLGTDALSIARVQSMRSILLTAMSTTMSVRVHWSGTDCYADNVMLCSDAVCKEF